MIDNFKNIEEFFKELDNYLDDRIEMYIIGGAAMLKRGMKAATKDIDLIVISKKEYLCLQSALENAGFIGQIPGKEYTHMNLSQIFQRGDLRIDLFHKEVCGRFSLTDEMRGRAERLIDLKKTNVFICSNEDILLFKTMTEREGDIADCISIATTQSPDWTIILDELINQINNSKQDVWVTWVGERFDILEDRKVDIPIMDEINRLREDFFDTFDKKQSK